MAGRPRMKLKRIEKLAQMALDLYNATMAQALERSRDPDQILQIDRVTDPVGWAWVEFLETTRKDVVDAYTLMNAQRRRLGMEPVPLPFDDGPAVGRGPVVGPGEPGSDLNDDGLDHFDDYVDDELNDDGQYEDHVAYGTPDSEAECPDPPESDEPPQEGRIQAPDGLEEGLARDLGF